MDKLEKLIYSVKYLPQILYFGSAALLILVIFLDINLIEIIIPLSLFFIYMTYLAIKNYKSGGVDPVEKFIYSNKYLPPLLYFGSAGIIFYDIFNGASFIPDHLQLPLFFFFLYMTHLAIKNYKKK